MAQIPAILYQHLVSAIGGGNTLLSDTTDVTTWVWGDTDNNGVANLADAFNIVLGFQGQFPDPDITPATLDIWPCVPNGVINLDDVQRDVFAFQGQTYEETGCPIPCAGGAATAMAIGDDDSQGSPVTIRIEPLADTVRAGGSVHVDVFIDDEAPLGAYELTLTAEGVDAGEVALVDLFVDEAREDYVFAAAESVSAVDANGMRLGAVRVDQEVHDRNGGYLAPRGPVRQDPSRDDLGGPRPRNPKGHYESREHSETHRPSPT